MRGPEDRLHLGLPAAERNGWPQDWAAGPTIPANRTPRPDEEPVDPSEVAARGQRRFWRQGFLAGFGAAHVFIGLALWLVILAARWLA